MKKLYIKPEIEILNLIPVDVITYSPGADDAYGDPDDGEEVIIGEEDEE